MGAAKFDHRQAVAGAHFAQHAVHVVLHRLLSDIELLRDFLVGQSTADHAHQLLLPGHVEHVLGFAVFRRTVEAVYGTLSTQALGSVHSLFEIAKQALSSVSDPRDHKAVAQQLKTMKIECVSGKLDFGAGPVPGVAVIKDIGAQWREGKEFPWDVYIVDNTPLPEVPVNGDLQRTA